jgi:hypothetical protein
MWEGVQKSEKEARWTKPNAWTWIRADKGVAWGVSW